MAPAPGDDTWRPRAAMPTPRGGCASAVIDGVLWCVGGEAGVAALSIAEGYDLAADRWSALPPLSSGRAGTGGAAIDGRMWIPGGAHRLRFEPTADVESLAP